uniref:Uncharacterized protein n=1 Tax=Aegilops tauschii subsp. strangulata TaxID=200361 RepID=A0A453Q5M1_AEGTS
MDSGGGATAIRVPYRHIRDAEMELVRLNSTNSTGGDAERPKEEQGSGAEAGEGGRKGAPKWRVVLACMVAAGVQFGWALQLSLLTPYIQVLLPRPPDLARTPPVLLLGAGTTLLSMPAHFGREGGSQRPCHVSFPIAAPSHATATANAGS